MFHSLRGRADATGGSSQLGAVLQGNWTSNGRDVLPRSRLNSKRWVAVDSPAAVFLWHHCPRHIALFNTIQVRTSIFATPVLCTPSASHYPRHPYPLYTVHCPRQCCLLILGLWHRYLPAPSSTLLSSDIQVFGVTVLQYRPAPDLALLSCSSFPQVCPRHRPLYSSSLHGSHHHHPRHLRLQPLSIPPSSPSSSPSLPPSSVPS